MKLVWKWFLQGIALVAPIALTIALLLWLGSWSEKTFGSMIKAVLPPSWYFDGLGLISGIVVILGIGLAANLFLVRRLVDLVESILERIPLVTSLFQAFKDVARLFSQDPDRQLGQVVAVDLGGMRLVGFVMQKEALLPGEFDDHEPRVAVYHENLAKLGDQLNKIKARFGSSTEDLARVAQQFVLKYNFTAAVIPGFRNLKQVKTNLAAMDKPLIDDEFEFIQSVFSEQ